MDLLTQLPQELVTAICADLHHLRDIQNLRLCCRALNEKLSSVFYDRHFRVMRVIITQESLQQLIALAQDENMRKAIKELELVHVTFNDRSRAAILNNPITPSESNDFEQLMAKLGLDPRQYQPQTKPPKYPEPPVRRPEIAAWEAKLRRKRRRLHDKHMHAQHRIRATGTDLTLLVEALNSLPALKVIRNVSKLETGPTMGVKNLPLGVQAIREDLGMWPVTADMPHMIPLILGAIHRSGIHLETLDLRGAPHDMPVARSPTSRKPSRTATPASTFNQSQFFSLPFSRLRRLYISFHGKEFYEHNSGQILVSLWIGPLLQTMTALRTLQISYVNSAPSDHIMQALCTLPSRQLHEIELSNLNLSLTSMKRFMARHRTTLRVARCIWPKTSEPYLFTDAHAEGAQFLNELDMPAMLDLRLFGMSSPGRRRNWFVLGNTPREFQEDLKSKASIGA